MYILGCSDKNQVFWSATRLLTEKRETSQTWSMTKEFANTGTRSQFSYQHKLLPNLLSLKSSIN
jgi:hypothetical protein